MRQHLLIGLVLLMGITAVAQPTYFIYLQSEPAQSFSVSIKGQTVLSSPSGYIIIPNLTDSVLQLVVGFPEKKYPDHPFILITQQGDQGYLLKDYGDKGWGLLDWRKLSVTYAQRVDLAKAHPITNADPSDFATMLAKASGDSTLLNKAAEATQKKEIKPATIESSTPATESKSPVATKPAILIKEDTTLVNKPVTATRPAQEQKPPVEKSTVPIPSYCKSILTDAEFKECLGKVEAAKSETAKVNVVREFIADRCYALDQVKAIALLLTTDEVRYDFLLEAWTHTAERPRYLSLVSVFSNAAAADRFKEMFQ